MSVRKPHFSRRNAHTWSVLIQPVRCISYQFTDALVLCIASGRPILCWLIRYTDAFHVSYPEAPPTAEVPALPCHNIPLDWFRQRFNPCRIVDNKRSRHHFHGVVGNKLEKNSTFKPVSIKLTVSLDLHLVSCHHEYQRKCKLSSLPTRHRISHEVSFRWGTIVSDLNQTISNVWFLK